MEKQEARGSPTGRQGGKEKKNKQACEQHTNKCTQAGKHWQACLCGERERCLETHGIKSKQFLVCKSHNLHRWHNKIDNLIDWHANHAKSVT